MFSLDESPQLACLIAYKGPFDQKMARNIKKLQECKVDVIIGCADDFSYNELKKCGLAELVKFVGDKGIYDCWNKLINFCNSDYICFFGKDDEIQKDKFLEYLGKVEKKLKYSDVVFPLLGARTVFDTSWLIQHSHKIVHPGTFYLASLFKRRKFDQSYPINADLLLNCDILCNENPSFIEYNDYADIGDGGVSQTLYKSVVDCWKIRVSYIGIKRATFQYLIDTISYLRRTYVSNN